ncbi:MAG: type II toxin-antitoxin system RelB/DinJ family antitoxin [bacterium]|nr:type II toxin-antitoxin system RelB/DinJ family antitoxin [bacterium]
MKTILNIKVDKEVKEQAFEVARDMGVPLSTLTNAFLKRLITERTATFTAPLIPSKKLIRILEQANKDIKKGINLSPVFTDVKDMDAYLRRL